MKSKWENSKGFGTMVSLIVCDESGDGRVTSFSNANALAEELRGGRVCYIPLIKCQITPRDEQFNHTSSASEIVLSDAAARGVRLAEDDGRLPMHRYR